MFSTSSLFIQCIVILIADVNAGPQSLRYSATIIADTVDFELDIFLNDNTVEVAQVINSVTGLPGCSFTTGDGALTAGTEFGADKRSISFTIDSAGTLSEKNTGTICPLEISDTDNQNFAFYVRGLGSEVPDGSNDREYFLVVNGANRTNVNTQGVASDSFVGPELPTKTIITPKTVTTEFELVNAESGITVSSIDVGSPGQLLARIIVDPHEDYVDIVGARITNCYVDDTGAFDNHNLTFIGADGCWLATDMFDNMNLDEGYQFNSSNKTLGVLTFEAITPPFEISAFSNALNSPNSLHFKCDIDYCFSTSDICYSEHCSPARRKRSLQGPNMNLITSVNITRNNDDACDKCSDSIPFIVSTASLGFLAAIVCGLMSCTFIGAIRIGKSSLLKQQRQWSDYFRSTPSNISSKSKTFSGSSRTSENLRKL